VTPVNVMFKGDGAALLRGRLDPANARIDPECISFKAAGTPGILVMVS
jgi:hypothetical protein